MPIDQSLKDTITYYTDRMNDDEIVDKMYNHPNQQDLRETIDYYRGQGESSAQILDRMMKAPVTTAGTGTMATEAPVSAPTQSYLGGVKQAAGDLAKKALPFMFEDKPASAAKGIAPSAPAQDTNVQGDVGTASSNFMPGKLKVGQAEPTLETPPSEAVQQTMMYGVNPMKEYGSAAGTAVGMAAAPELGPLAIPVSAGMGRMLAGGLQSPLTNLLLPKANMPAPGAGETLMNFGKGAEEGALQGIGMRGTAAPAESLADILAPLKEGTGNLSKYMSRKALRVPLSAETKGAIATVPEEGLNVVGGKAPAQIAERVNSLSRQVDNYIGQATEQGKQIMREDMLAPARKLQEVYAKSADTAEYGQKLANYIAEVEAQVPEVVSPEQAQGIKKFVYDSINFDAKGANQLSQSAVQGKRAFGRGTRSELEGAAPEIGPINARLSKLLEARPTVEQSAAKWSEAGPMKSTMGHLKQAGARGAGAVSRGLGAVEDYLRAPTSTAGGVNPMFPNLSKLMMNEPEYGYDPFANVGGQKLLPPIEKTPINVPPAARITGRTSSLGPLERGEATPRTRNRFGGTAPVPENLPERGFTPAEPASSVKELIDRIASGQGHTITAEEKVSLADAMLKRIEMIVTGGTPKVKPPTKEGINLNFNERMKE